MPLVSQDMRKDVLSVGRHEKKALVEHKSHKNSRLVLSCLEKKGMFLQHPSLHLAHSVSLGNWLKKNSYYSNPTIQWVSSEWRVSSKVKKPMSIIWKGSRKWASSKVKKQMGIIEREASELVSSGVYGYHQKWAWWGLTQFNDTYKLHWSNLLQLRVNKTFRSFSVVFFSLAVSMS
jgi:hypothetical protein